MILDKHEVAELWAILLRARENARKLMRQTGDIQEFDFYDEHGEQCTKWIERFGGKKHNDD